MSKGMIRITVLSALLLLPAVSVSAGEIYKIVDENGNVTFTDQRPSADAQPVELKPLSVIETDIEVPEPPSAETADAATAEAEKELTPRELKKKFRDFRITQPQQEETFWGTANTVVVTWGSSEQMLPDMSVMLFVDGEAQKAPATGGATLTLDRGEHQVYAELRDGRNRRIITTDKVTFFVKQHSVNFNRPVAAPRNSGS